MNREIKFRVWDLIENKFDPEPRLKISLLNCSDYSAKLIPAFTRYILQQFTGMIDKNEYEIYEGDKVSLEKMDGTRLTGIVAWDNHEGGWIIKDDAKDYYPCLCSMIASKCEVIRNI